MKGKLLKFFKELVIYVVIITALIYGIPKALVYVLGTEYPLASITSSSMWPALKEGDLVLIKAIAQEELAIGDIVVYQNLSTSSRQVGFTIHRIVKLNENTLVTKGDANNINDNPVEYKQVIGKVVETKSKPLRLPYLGVISVLVQKYKS